MNILKQNKYRVSLILLGLLLISGWFYWFQYRPGEVRRSCAEEATKGPGTKKAEDNRYRECLAKHGLKPESLFVGN